MLSKTVGQPASNWLADHPSKGQHCIGEEALRSEQNLKTEFPLQIWTCKNNAHSERADAQLFGKDGKEGGDGGRGRKEEKEMALWFVTNYF